MVKRQISLSEATVNALFTAATVTSRRTTALEALYEEVGEALAANGVTHADVLQSQYRENTSLDCTVTLPADTVSEAATTLSGIVVDPPVSQQLQSAAADIRAGLAADKTHGVITLETREEEDQTTYDVSLTDEDGVELFTSTRESDSEYMYTYELLYQALSAARDCKLTTLDITGEASELPIGVSKITSDEFDTVQDIPEDLKRYHASISGISGIERHFDRLTVY